MGKRRITKAYKFMEDNKILYDYKRRSSIVDENSLATLDYLYSLSMPKPLTSYSEMEMTIHTQMANMYGLWISITSQRML